MKRLYEKYINNIQNVINKPTGLGYIHERTSNFSGADGDFEKSLLSESRVLEPKTGMEQLAKLMNIKEVKAPFMGDHPDFKHLRTTNKADYHYITSMFIDVKNSTNFHRKYDLDQIAMIIQTIVTAATHTCALFGGHIQRMQYDGVFAYFGGRTISKEDSVKAAINAASFFTYFIRYELREVFQMEDIDNIYTRIGIDFGDDKEVQWIVFGTAGCSELTTNSLHTSLAPKMQSNAESNGIVIGDNVKARLGHLELLCDFLRDEKGNVDTSKRYIYKDTDKGFYYGQYKFKWDQYLKKFSFVKTDKNGNLYIDYDSTSVNDESSRLEKLYHGFNILKGGNASFDQNELNDNGRGVNLQNHRFHRR